MAPLSSSKSAPIIGGLKGGSKSGGNRTGRIKMAEAEIKRAQKALLMTSEQMRQEAAGFMLGSDYSGQKSDKLRRQAEKDKKAKWDETKKEKVEDIIPDDFLLNFTDEVDQWIADKYISTPKSLPLTASPWVARPARTIRGAGAVEISDFVVSSPSDATIRPESPPKRARVQTEEVPRTISDDAGQVGRPRSRTAGLLDTSSTATIHPGHDPHGWAAKLAASNRTEESTPRNGLLEGSLDELMADLKEGAEMSRIETESRRSITPMAN